MGRRRILVRSGARVSRIGLEGTFDRLYRLGPRLNSTDPDDLNVVIIRVLTTIEEVCRGVLEIYLVANPDDDSVELIVRRGAFDAVRRSRWEVLAASSLNVSSIDDVRSILDKCGLGCVLTEGRAKIFEDVAERRNMVVHGGGDATQVAAKVHRTTEEFARDVFSNDPSIQVMMDSAKARAASQLAGCPWDPREWHESVVGRCDAVNASSLTPLMLVRKGASLAALGRHSEALESYNAAVGLDGDSAAAHAGRGEARRCARRPWQAFRGPCGVR